MSSNIQFSFSSRPLSFAVLRLSLGLNSEARHLCAGHNAANVVDTAGVVGSNSVGVSSIGVGGVGDGSNSSRSSSLHLNLGGGSNDVSTSSQVGVGAVGVGVGGVSDGRCSNNGGSNGLHVDVGLCNIASGVMDIGKSLRGLHALLRDGAGKSQGNGRQENK